MNIQEIRKKYPQYEDMTDAELSKAIHAKFYADMPYKEFSAKVPGAASEPEGRSFGGSLMRQAGLSARAGIGALASIPNMIADPIVSGINALGGNLPIPSQALERTMTSAGMPEPSSGTERFANSVVKGAGGAAGFAKLPGNTLPILQQVIAGGAGAGGADLAGQAGFGPVGQTIAGLTTGIVAPTAAQGAIEGVKAVSRAAPALAEPLTAAGRERIKARALQTAAQDPQAAAMAAGRAPEYVPGSVPTLAQATADRGISAQSKAIQNRFPSDFSQRAADQDAARQAGLSRSFGDQTMITMAEEARNAATTPMREAAFASAKKVNTKPIFNAAESILRSGAGKRQEVERALNWVKGQLEGENDAQRIYAVRQDINDIIAGKLANNPEKASFQLAAGELKAIKGVLDGQLEKAAPGFKDYLKTYAGMSKEIDKAKLGQEITDKARIELTQTISPASFTREFAKRGEEIANAGPVASDALTRVAMDMQRSQAPAASMRAAGSDTLQNIVSNNILSRAGVRSDGPISNAASRGLGLLYRPFGVEDKILEGLRDAHLDPKEGARLLSMQLSKMPKADIDEILRKLYGIPVGGLLGVSAAN